jgi:inward rectifier potassium channel
MKTKNKSQDTKEFGFGAYLNPQNSRLVNKDGTANINRIGVPVADWLNLYHRLITMSWWKFGVLVFAFFLIANLFFAVAYFIVGVENLAGVHGNNLHDYFWEAFFFSAQTLTTVGYGRISPTGFSASFLAAIESLMGLLAFALATGLLYGRFSRPVARISFSKHALILPHNGNYALMFRLVGLRKITLMNLAVEVVFSKVEENNGHRQRNYYTLKLERDRITSLPMSWTLVHNIQEDSPLFQESAESLSQSEAEIIILFQATNETFSENVHKRTSYHHSEILWNKKFVPMFKTETKGTTLDLRMLDVVTEVAI